MIFFIYSNQSSPSHSRLNVGCCAFLGEPQLSIFRCCRFRLGSNFCLQLPAISHLITAALILSQALRSLHLAPLSQGSVTPE